MIWALGVLVTQITTDKRPMVKLFNIGVGVVGGGGRRAWVIYTVRGPERLRVTARELLAVALAAACYFATDFLHLGGLGGHGDRDPAAGPPLAARHAGPRSPASCRSTPWATSAPWSAHNLQPWTLAAAGRAAGDPAGRHPRGGAGHRERPPAQRAVRGRDARPDAVRHPAGARRAHRRRPRLLRIRRWRSGPRRPVAHEVGAQLRDGQRDRWIVAPGQHRARSTTTADQQALEAMVAVSSDAFARLRLTEDMTHLARHDLLTNLPNRGLLLDRVEHALQMSRRRGTRIALLFVDLDGFKPVNDRFGHAAGDAVLIDVAGRLTGCVRQSDTVARLGGDEFALLLEDVHPPEVSTACDRILAALSRGAHVAGHQLALSASIGVAFGDSSETAESMLRNADLAMYEAKARGKNQWVEYERAIGRSRLQRLELVESLRASVAAGDLTLVYQPVVRASTGFITGVEALARWKSNGVDVPPDVFIRVAEETGLVVALGDVVLDQAARDAAVIEQAAGAGDINVSVNISAKQLREPDFVSKVERAMAKMDGADAGPGDHRARRHRQRPGVDERDDHAGRARRAVRDRRLRGRASPRSATCRTCRCRSSRPTCRSRRASTATSGPARCCARSR